METTVEVGVESRGTGRREEVTVHISIRLLGDLEILLDGVRAPQALPASRKTRALLGYLIATGQVHRREHLCDLLWDGPDDPRAELRWSLSKIRTALSQAGPVRLLADRERVGFDATGVDVDLVTLRRLFAGGTGAAPTDTLREAVSLFRGEFLDGLEVPRCFRFQEWCLAEREAASTLRLSALNALVERLVDVAPEEALVHARALVTGDPLSEVGHAAVVRLLDRIGRRRQAQEHHDRARRMLERELAAPLSGALERARRGLEFSLRRHTPPPPGSAKVLGDAVVTVGDPHPIVGRWAERALLGEQAAAAAAGRACRVPLITGEPGIGKSRLLGHLGDQIVRLGGRVLAARSFEAEGGRIYGVWIDALRTLPIEDVPPDLRIDLAPLRPELGPEQPTPPDRTRLFDAIVALLVRLADRQPTAVLLDDIQWIDDASAAMFHYAIRAAGGKSPLLFACAARAGELEDNPAAARLARAFGREGRLLALKLGPLATEEAEALVRAVDPELDVAAIAAESEGNPLLALEITRARRGGAALATTAPTLEALITGQIARLSQRAQEALVWASALGRGFDPDLLGRASGLQAPDLAAVLEEWERRGIIRPFGGVPDGYDFAHDLVRQAVYRGASQPRRRLVHRHIARLLDCAVERDGALAADLARHAEVCGESGLAVKACRVAGDRCIRLFAAAEAAGFAERGLFHLDRLPATTAHTEARIDLLRIWVRAAHGPGLRRLPPDIAETVSRATAAAEAAGFAESAAMGHHLLSVLHVDSGDAERARDSTLRAAEAGRATVDVVACARQLANSARCLVDLEVDVDRARALFLEAEGILDGLGVEVCELHWGRGLLERWDGAFGNGVSRIQSALALARSEQDRWREYQCLTCLSIALLEQGRQTEARICFAELSMIASKIGAEDGPFADVLDALVSLGTDVSFPGAESRLIAAVSRLRDADCKARLAYALNAAAKCHLQAGRIGEARACAGEALAAAMAVRRNSEATIARAILVRVDFAAGTACPTDDTLACLLAEVASAPSRIDARARAVVLAAAADAEQRVSTLAPTVRGQDGGL